MHQTTFGLLPHVVNCGQLPAWCGTYVCTFVPQVMQKCGNNLNINANGAQVFVANKHVWRVKLRASKGELLKGCGHGVYLVTPWQNVFDANGILLNGLEQHIWHLGESDPYTYLLLYHYNSRAAPHSMVSRPLCTPTLL